MSGQAAIAARLARLPPFADGQAQPVQRLGRGPSSETWLVRHRGEELVLRLDTALADGLQLDRPGEARIIEHVARAGLGPQLVFSEPADGVLVTRYIEGRALQPADLHNPAMLERLAAMLRRLHALRPAVRPLDLGGAMRRYAGQLGDRRAAAWARQGTSLLSRRHTRATGLCHNDLVAANIVEADRLWLIDWEYAGLGDPLFDLAIVVRHHELDEHLTAAFLRAYNGGADPGTEDDLRRLCDAYDRLLALWLSVVERDAGLGEEQQAQRARAIGRIG